MGNSCLLRCIAVSGFVASTSAAPYTADTNVGTAATWPAHGGGDDESGFSSLDAINTRNVSQLGLAWFLNLDHEQVLEATPLAVDGVLYFTGSYSAVYAVDAVTGKLLWKHDPEVWKHNPAKLRSTLLPVNRGAAYSSVHASFPAHWMAD
jgi:quinohemoprotein ethanol dehydrogenase